MNIGDRIRIRREELGLSQDELAKRMGYTSRSTINKVEKGINDVTQTNVVKYAKALDTTVAYLMGWEEPTAPERLDAELGELLVHVRQNEDLQELVQTYSRLDRYQQEILLKFVHSLLPDARPERSHKDNPE